MNARLVIADDEPDLLRLVSFVLKDYTLFAARDGEEALHLIRQEQPDLIVMDVRMPGMSGLEVAEAMAKDAQVASIPIIFLSAKGQEVEIEAGLQTGAKLYIVKPFDPAELVLQVEELLKSPYCP